MLIIKMTLIIGKKVYTRVKGPVSIQFFHNTNIPDLILCKYENDPVTTDIFKVLKNTIHFTFKQDMLSNSQIIKYYKYFSILLEKDKKHDHMLEDYSRDNLIYEDYWNDIYRHYECREEIENNYINYMNYVNEFSYNLSIVKNKDTVKENELLSQFLDKIKHDKKLIWLHNWYVEKWSYIKALKIVNKEIETNENIKCIVVHSYFRHIFYCKFSEKLRYNNMCGVYKSFSAKEDSSDFNGGIIVNLNYLI